MIPPRRPPIPEHLRPAKAARRRRRRGWLWLALLPLPLLGITQWKVVTVEITQQPWVPPTAVASIRSLIGTPMVLVHLDWVRRHLDRWPTVGGVEVLCRLDGTVLVTTRPARAAASIRVGSGWHGIDRHGQPTGRLSERRTPVLHCAGDSDTLGSALSVARRLEALDIGAVQSVTFVSPSVLAVDLENDGRSFTAHVRTETSDSEEGLTRLWSTRRLPDHGFVDATRDDRLVVGERGGSA